MDAKSVLAELGEQAKALVEQALEKLVNEKADAAVGAAVKKIEELIPGNWDDVVLEGAKVKIAAVIKAELLKEIEKISDRV